LFDTSKLWSIVSVADEVKLTNGDCEAFVVVFLEQLVDERKP
jgi:hypothetical protein